MDLIHQPSGPPLGVLAGKGNNGSEKEEKIAKFRKLEFTPSHPFPVFGLLSGALLIFQRRIFTCPKPGNDTSDGGLVHRPPQLGTNLPGNLLIVERGLDPCQGEYLDPQPHLRLLGGSFPGHDTFL